MVCIHRFGMKLSCLEGENWLGGKGGLRVGEARCEIGGRSEDFEFWSKRARCFSNLSLFMSLAGGKLLFFWIFPKFLSGE